MKLRTSYVSNSSSSSFVIMYNDGSKMTLHGQSGNSFECDFTVNDLIELINHSDAYSSDCTEIVANGYENVKSCLTEKDEYGYSNYDEKYSDAILRKMEQNRNEYPEVMILKIEYYDKIVRKIMDAFVESGEFILLDESEA